MEHVARLAVAELTPRASSKDEKETRGGSGSPALGVEARNDLIVTNATSADGSARVTERELGDAIETAFRKIVGQDEAVVLRGGAFSTGTVARKLIERLPSLIDARRQALTEKNIDALVDAYLPVDALAPVMPDIEADNARAQADFLKAHPVLTADEVATRAGHGAVNRSATANRWKAERKIFAVRAGGREVYPSFQFEQGRPRASLRSALRALDCRSGWQTAFWFITPNSWLGGAPPIDRLEDGEALAAAAAREAEAVAG